MKKLWNKETDIDDRTRYCKKCGCELVSSNKRNLCANCQSETGKRIRNGILTVLSLLVGAGALGWLNSQNSEDSEDLSEDDDNDDFNV